MQAEYFDNKRYFTIPIVALALVESNNDPSEREVIPMSCDGKGNIDFCENDADYKGVRWD